MSKPKLKAFSKELHDAITNEIVKAHVRDNMPLIIFYRWLRGLPKRLSFGWCTLFPVRYCWSNGRIYRKRFIPRDIGGYKTAYWVVTLDD